MDWKEKYLNKIVCGDCTELMKELPDKCIDMILCDLPYGKTDCRWDSIISLNSLWKEYKRIIALNSPIILTAVNPFASNLIMTNIEWFKYDWVWEKNAGSNFGTVKYQPMREHELILVFGKGSVKYFPIMEERAPSGKARVQTVVNYDTDAEVYSKGALKGKVSSKRPDLRYPRSIQRFNRERGLHPTQKPVGLFEYLIKTYTNEGDLVLDNCIGSGTTAVACENLKRKWIGIEKEEKYCEIARKRLEEETTTGGIF